MSIVENAGVTMDSSDQNSNNNTASLEDTKSPCPDDQKLKSSTSVETPNLANESVQRTSEVNPKSHLNPLAKEFVPSLIALYHSEFLRNRLWFANNFPMQVISIEENVRFTTRRMNFNQGRRWTNRRTNFGQNEDVIKRTVYVSDIDQQVTEEQLASLFSSCGQVVDCRICGDHKSILRFAFIEFTNSEGARSALRKSGTMFGSHAIRVLISKTAIAPVNPYFLPRSEEEREKCGRTVYCTNIDKMVTRTEMEDFFKTACGEIQHLSLLGDSYHQTRIAFVEFKLAESALSALNCSGIVLGGLPIRVSPSKTPVRPHRSDIN
ncbi:hypothetical protein CARUB_v10003348mg [Capsella rubella]|uniref:RRM domain-containing protein n=1 Tax=Capsella rubella TaxID=81985 RepID=R0FCX6_9BRAS|nr:polyadenylate-binding protein-interacting protein 13 [Capsella rubella]EOA19681.1 hypothetical protein CARUB_v10003348mg [Capsella rubella]